MSDVLGDRIRELKKHVEFESVELPVGISPRDIERLGRKLIWQARRRLLDLIAADNAYRSPLRLAEQYRDGLIILLFSVTVLRVSNMAAILLEGFLKKKHGVWSISIPGQHAKNGKPFHHPLDDWLGFLIDEYKNTIRKLIADVTVGINDDVFWIARHGGALRAGAFQEIVPRHCLSEFEVRLYCHLLRAIEASHAMSTLDVDSDYGSATLRHKSPEVTRRYYHSEEVVQRAPALLEGVKTFDQALPVIDPAAVTIGLAKRVQHRS